MTHAIRLLLSAGFLIGLTGAAHAGDLVTSAVRCTGRFFGCIVLNISDKPLSFTFETATGSFPVTDLQPGSAASSSGSCSGIEFCRVSGVSKRSVRASYCVSATAGGPCDVVGDAR